MDKKEVRREIFSKLSQMTDEEIARSNDAIFDKLSELPEFLSAKVIFLYISVGHEADTYRILNHALKLNKRVCIPKCEEKGIMHAVEISGEGDLVPDKFSIPTAREDCAEVPVGEIDFVISPGVAFDSSGHRLGRGGGYYDRFLNKLSAFSVGICHPCQLLPIIDVEEHDVPVDLVITN